MATDDRATFVRWVSDTEAVAGLASDCKALTWETAREHAVLLLADGRRTIVRGGQYRIELESALPAGLDPFARPAGSLWVDTDQGALRVMELVLHTHPKPTGPSDDDLRLLARLGQPTSLLFEIFGPADGTVIRPKGNG